MVDPREVSHISGIRSVVAVEAFRSGSVVFRHVTDDFGTTLRLLVDVPNRSCVTEAHVLVC